MCMEVRKATSVIIIQEGELGEVVVEGDKF